MGRTPLACYNTLLGKGRGSHDGDRGGGGGGICVCMQVCLFNLTAIQEGVF